MSDSSFTGFRCKRCGRDGLANVKITRAGEWVCGGCFTDADWSVLTPTPQESQITALTAERDALRGEVERLKANNLAWEESHTVLKMDHADAVAERDDLARRLRECEAERESWRILATRANERADAAEARLARAERVVEAAKALVDDPWYAGTNGVRDHLKALRAALDGWGGTP